MKVIDKPLMVNGFQLGMYQAYTDIDPDFVPVDFGARVLPAPFFAQRSHFTLVKKWMPGEKSTFPNGGYEIRGEGGEIRSFDLDQIILYPETKTQKKVIDAMSPADENAPARGRRAGSGAPKPEKVEGRRRGRPAMSEEDKAKKLAEQSNKIQKSGGKRGRPANPDRPKTTKVSTGGKRGRPRLSADVIALKIADKAIRSTRSGGKRGRPSLRK